jgi:hypothetical protein
MAVLLPLGLSPAQEPPPNSDTPEGTAKLAAAARKYDIAGIKLGTPIKKRCRRSRRTIPSFSQYDVLGGDLLSSAAGVLKPVRRGRS